MSWPEQIEEIHDLHFQIMELCNQLSIACEIYEGKTGKKIGRIERLRYAKQYHQSANNEVKAAIQDIRTKLKRLGVELPPYYI